MTEMLARPLLGLLPVLSLLTALLYFDSYKLVKLRAVVAILACGAVIHGGATASFGVMGLAMVERRPGRWVQAFLPGLVLAILLHSGFNQFFLSPRTATLSIVGVLPPLLYAVFRFSERSLGEWLGK